MRERERARKKERAIAPYSIRNHPFFQLSCASVKDVMLITDALRLSLVIMNR